MNGMGDVVRSIKRTVLTISECTAAVRTLAVGAASPELFLP